MTRKRNGATLEQGAPSKTNLKASTQIIPQPSRRSKRTSRRAAQVELAFLMAARRASR